MLAVSTFAVFLQTFFKSIMSEISIGQAYIDGISFTIKIQTFLWVFFRIP